jgi:ribosomal protein S18 acetylase RimI-like enzyme
MSTTEKQGLQKRSTLTEDEIAEITALAVLCNEHDNLHMRIPLDALHQRSGHEIDDFLYYEQGTLVGYLYMDSWGQKEKEFTGMVKPEFRRRSIFRQLFEATLAECKEHGVERMILVNEQRSHSGHAFAKAIKAHYDFSEHEMVLGDFIERQQTDPEFQMHQATTDDKEAIISIIATDMEGDLEDARQLVEEFYAAPDQKLYLSKFAGKPLGCLRLDYRSDEVGIYGFVIRPEYRGRGHGRRMLEYVIHRVYDEGPRTIMLEVETTNHNAIGLYGSCGFHVRTTYDYFNRDIER